MGLLEYKGRITKRKHRIGYAPEDYVMPNSMTVLEFLMNIGRIKKEEEIDLNKNVRYYLEYFYLLDHQHKLIGSLSNGMKQKINLLQAFVHNPKVIILDEPLASLDKESVHKVVKLISLQAKNRLMVISTHQTKQFRTKNKKFYHFKDGCLIDA